MTEVVIAVLVTIASTQVTTLVLVIAAEAIAIVGATCGRSS